MPPGLRWRTFAHVRSLILGAAGQDGLLLAQLLQSEGATVSALVRPGSERTAELKAAAPGMELIYGDVTDRYVIRALIKDLRPTEVYNLAAVSSVAQSWEHPDRTVAVNLQAVVGLLEEVRALGRGNGPRIFQASSSEMFGTPLEVPQVETTLLQPASPYGVAKAGAHQLVGAYRRAYGLFCCSGILYNHESPLRPSNYVTRKVTRGAAAIALGRADELVLGDLSISRDWGYARDYVRAMVLMLRAPVADDYIIATGISHTLEDLVAAAFRAAGIEDWRPFVRSDPSFIRPGEITGTVGDASKARELLGWRPTLGFEEVVAGMVAADLASLRAERALENV